MKTNLLSRLKSRLFSLAWWKASALRGLYTAVAVTVPYLGGALLADIQWSTAASAAGLGFLASIATSLAGLPEAEGVDLPWWLAAVERVTKTFAQALAAGFLGATLITDVPWSTVIQAALIASLLSLLRLILATLPADPTPAPVGLPAPVYNGIPNAMPVHIVNPVVNPVVRDKATWTPEERAEQYLRDADVDRFNADHP